jgi:hypothetical protein
MSSSTSHSRGSHKSSHGGGGGSHGGGEGGGGGGGGGPLVKVGFGRNQAEAEMLQGLLSEAGIPSILKRSGGFDNPDFLSAGPRDVFVVSDLAHKARGVLAETMVESEPDEAAELREQMRLAGGGGETSPARLAAWVAAAAVGGLILVWILYQLS